MSLPIFQRTIVDSSGNIQPGASVAVRNETTGDLVTIYADREGGTAKANPFLADSEGFATFYVEPGEYQVTATTTAGTITWSHVAIGDTALLQLAQPTGDTLVGSDDGASGSLWTTAAGFIARQQAERTGVNLLRYIPPDQWPAIANYTSTYDATADINAALLNNKSIIFPKGLVRSWGGHVITGKEIYGVSRESSIIKALGVNQAVTLFVNDKTDHTTPGTWGSGKDFRIENLGIRGNWDKVTGLTSVTESGATMNVGVLKASYSPAQSALIKGVSAAYCNIINCYIDDAWEHGILFFRLGYAEISGNIVARCRGSGVWLTADSAAASITSTIVERNQIVANRGGYGGLRTLYTYGCAFRDNRPFEDNTWGATFGEGADTDISGNYFEINPFGDASIDPTIWGLSLVNNYWTIPPTLPSGPSARGFFSYDRKNGLRHLCVPGLGETDNRLGPIRYSSETETVGIGRDTPPAPNGLGLTFPATAVPSSDPNTLDDYQEEGWNVTDASGAGLALAVTGQYTKIGNVVTFVCSVVFPTTSNATSVTLGGLPAAAAALTPVSVVSNHVGGLSGFILSGTATLKFTGPGTFTEKTNVNLSGAVLYISGTYRAAA